MYLTLGFYCFGSRLFYLKITKATRECYFMKIILILFAFTIINCSAHQILPSNERVFFQEFKTSYEKNLNYKNSQIYWNQYLNSNIKKDEQNGTILANISKQCLLNFEKHTYVFGVETKSKNATVSFEVLFKTYDKKISLEYSNIILKNDGIFGIPKPENKLEFDKIIEECVQDFGKFLVASIEMNSPAIKTKFEF